MPLVVLVPVPLVIQELVPLVVLVPVPLMIQVLVFIDTDTIFSIAVIVTVIKTFIEIVANKTIANITIFTFTCVVTCGVMTQTMFSTKITVIKWISGISYSFNWIECTFVTVLTFDTITEETFDT